MNWISLAKPWTHCRRCSGDLDMAYDGDGVQVYRHTATKDRRCAPPLAECSDGVTAAKEWQDEMAAREAEGARQAAARSPARAVPPMRLCRTSQQRS